MYSVRKFWIKVTNRKKIRFLFIIFLIISLTSTLSLFYITYLSQNDARVINIAGRQRMLSQKMSKEAIYIVLNQNNIFPENIEELKETRKLFELSHHGLRYGNSNLELPETTDNKARTQWNSIDLLWIKFKKLIVQIENYEISNDIAEEIKEDSVYLLNEINILVEIYEEIATEKNVLSLFVSIFSVIFTIIIAILVVKFNELNRSLKNSIIELNDIRVNLELSNKELENFVSITSHDLQEPLRKIHSFSELLENSTRDKISEDDRIYLNFIRSGVFRMNNLVRGLASYSRMDREIRHFELVDLNDIINNVISIELGQLIAETNANIIISNILPSVYGDDTQLHQLFQNLIANAIKFTDKGTTPEISIFSEKIADQPDWVEIRIIDNGIGIKKSDHNKIFKMYQRLHSKSEYPGSGIGLALCKKIVERHEGKIGVNSTKENGSTFWIKFPLKLQGV